MTLNPVEQFKELEKLLKNKKKVCLRDRKLRFYEDFNNLNASSWSSVNTKYTDVEYLYTNPQFNRMFAHLEDGRDVDYTLSFLDIVYNHFIEYIPPAPPKRKMTIAEIEQVLGYEVDLIKDWDVT